MKSLNRGAGNLQNPNSWFRRNLPKIKNGSGENVPQNLWDGLLSGHSLVCLG